MDDQGKTKEQLIEELETLRAQLAAMEAEHEQIRHLLTFAIGYSELATETVESGKPDLAALAVLLSKLSDAAERAKYTLQFGDRPLNLTSFALGEVVGQVQAEFQSEAENKEIELTFTAPEEAEPVVADEEIVRQVIESMLDSALRFTAPKGRVNIEVKPVPEGQQASVRHCPFLDIHKRIYSAIDRAGIPRPEKGGVGLGLAFCKLAIEAHGGRVWAETMPEEEAFHFILPVKQE